MLRLPIAAWLAVAASLVAAPGFAAEPSTEARRLYAEGKAEYAQGHYVEAVALFERSYALFESPALLFNMAQAHRLAGPEHCADALALYKSYLLSQPDAENRREVEERIQELGECPVMKPPADVAPPVTTAAVSAAPAPSPRVAAPAQLESRPPPAPQTGASLSAPILVAGTGAALLVAGGVLYARAWDKHREAEKICPCYPGTYEKWEVLSNVSYALLAVGGATLAGGVTWWVVAEPGAKGRGARAGLGVSGRF
jgi:tetratricopeptide (TPR) repeat protein